MNENRTALRVLRDMLRQAYADRGWGDHAATLETAIGKIKYAMRKRRGRK